MFERTKGHLKIWAWRGFIAYMFGVIILSWSWALPTNEVMMIHADHVAYWGEWAIAQSYNFIIKFLE